VSGRKSTVDKKTVVVTKQVDDQGRRVIESELADLADIVYLWEAPDRGAALRKAHVLISMMFPREVAKEEYGLLNNLALLQAVVAGVDFMPLDRLPPGAILCANVGAWADPMAEHLLGMILALGKNFLPNHLKLARGEFDRNTTSKRFRGGVAGILGFGGIGRATAKLLRALGMHIHAINSTGQTEEPVDFIGTLDDLYPVLSVSDVVLVSLPLNKRTRHLIGPEQFARMKPDAVFINAARAEIVQEEALYAHLKDHPDFRAGTDVWWEEPMTHGTFRVGHPFFDLENFLGSPHNSPVVAGVFEEALAQAVQNVRLFLKGEPIRGKVNRSDYL
jgi:phosphoglycerate dehydrogenase-like enzyme